jgi:hypothetical protein
MQDINLIDRTFHKDASENYSLSIQANHNGLIYCIFDNKAGHYLLIRGHGFKNVHLAEDLNVQIAEVLEKDDILNLHFHQVVFLGYTQQSTLIPSSFYSRDKMADYLDFNLAGEVDHETFSSFIAPLDIYNVFALPRDLVSRISLHFKKVVFLNQTAPFLMHLASRKEAFSSPAMHVGLNSSFFDLAASGEKKLHLYNTFQYVSESDLLYYILYAYKQLGYETQTVPLFISGEQSSRMSYFEILKQYIPKTNFAAVQGIPLLAPGLHQLHIVRFLNLLNLQTCVLSAEHTGVEK